jgi:hypothetical protein
MAGEEGRTRRVAERELAVVAIEADAFGGKGVDVWAVSLEATVVAGELGAHVVGHEEEDVKTTFAGVGCGGFFGGLGCGFYGRRECSGEGGPGGFGKEAAAGGCGALFGFVWIAHVRYMLLRQ